MKNAARINEAAKNGTAEAVAPVIPADIRPKTPFVGFLLRLVRLRSRAAGKDAVEVVPPRGRVDQRYEAARSSMEAGLTRGASLLFSNRR